MKRTERNNINILGGYKAKQSSEHAYMKRLFTLFLLGTGLAVFGQQDIQFTQFMNNRLFYNPGVAGSSGSICITGAHRSQWVGFENAPTTQNVNVEVPLQILHGGLYVNVVNDQIGFFNNQSFGLGYAYQMNLGDGVLGIGAGVNMYTSAIAGTWNAPQNNIDPSIPLSPSSGLTIDGNFGAYYQDGKIWAGVSTRRLIGASTDYSSTQIGTVTEIQHVRHYIIMGGYNYALPGSNLVLMPSALVKLDEYSLNPQADINISAMYNNQIWGGVSYRIQDAFAIMAGYQILPELRIAYSYDLTTSDLNNASAGSHEITANYCFKIEIPPKIKERHGNTIFL